MQLKEPKFQEITIAKCGVTAQWQRCVFCFRQVNHIFEREAVISINKQRN